MKSKATVIYKGCFFLFMAASGFFLHTAFAKSEALKQRAQTAKQADLKLTNIELAINGVRNSKGTLRVLVFAQADGFPSEVEKAVFKADVPANTSVSLSIPDLKLGEEYAFTVMHDEDNSGKLSTNFLGIPKEGIGLSRSPSLLLGKPKFEQCTLLIDQENQIVPIKLSYF